MNSDKFVIDVDFKNPESIEKGAAALLKLAENSSLTAKEIKSIKEAFSSLAEYSNQITASLKSVGKEFAQTNKKIAGLEKKLRTTEKELSSIQKSLASVGETAKDTAVGISALSASLSTMVQKGVRDQFIAYKKNISSVIKSFDELYAKKGSMSTKQVSMSTAGLEIISNRITAELRKQAEIEAELIILSKKRNVSEVNTLKTVEAETIAKQSRLDAERKAAAALESRKRYAEKYLALQKKLGLTDAEMAKHYADANAKLQSMVASGKQLASIKMFKQANDDLRKMVLSGKELEKALATQQKILASESSSAKKVSAELAIQRKLRAEIAALRSDKYSASVLASRKAETIELRKQLILEQQKAGVIKANTEAMKQAIAANKWLSSMQARYGGDPAADEAKYRAASAALNKMVLSNKEYREAVKLSNSASKKQAAIFHQLSGVVRGVAGSFGKLWLSYGAIVPMLVAFGSASFVANVYKMGSAFEYTTQQIASIANATQKAIVTGEEFKVTAEEISQGLLNIENSMSSPQELADGLLLMVKAGYSVDKALASMEGTMKFAAVTGVDMAQATALSVTQMKAWGAEVVGYDRGVKDIAQAQEVMAKTALMAKTDLKELQTALSATTELASMSGVSFVELNAALGKLADIGLQGSKGAIALRTSIIRLQTPTSKVNKLLKEFGLSMNIFDDKGQFKGFVSMFSEINRVTKDLTDKSRSELFREMFGLRAMRGGANVARMFSAEIVKGTWSLEEFVKQLQKVKDEGGFIDSVYAELSKTAKGSWTILVNEFRNLMTELNKSEELIYMISKLRDAIKDPRFKEAVDNFLRTIGAILLMFTEAVSSGVALQFFRDISVGVLIVAKAIEGLATGIREIKDFVRGDLGRLLTMTAGGLTLGPPGAMAGAMSAASLSAWEHTVALVKEYSGGVDDASDKVTKHSKTVEETMADIINSVNKVFRDFSKAKDELVTKPVVEAPEESNFGRSMIQSIERTRGEVERDLEKVKDRYDSVGKAAKLSWEQAATASKDSIDYQLAGIDYLFQSVEDKGTSVSGSLVTQAEKDNGMLLKQYRRVNADRIAEMRRANTLMTDEYSKALNDRLEKLKAYIAEQNAALSGIKAGYKTKIGSILGKFHIAANTKELFNEDQIKRMGNLLRNAAEDGAVAFKEMGKDIENTLNSVIRLEQNLVNKIKGYTNDMLRSQQTADDARFAVYQDMRNEHEKYVAQRKRAYEYFDRAEAAFAAAQEASGSVREEMYKRGNALAEKALGLATSLSAAEKSGISKKQEHIDKLELIDKYDKMIYTNAGKMKTQAEQELELWRKNHEAIQNMADSVDRLVKALSEIHGLDIDNTNFKNKITEADQAFEAFSDKVSKLGDKEVDKSKIDSIVKMYKDVDGVYRQVITNKEKMPSAIDEIIRKSKDETAAQVESANEQLKSIKDIVNETKNYVTIIPEVSDAWGSDGSHVGTVTDSMRRSVISLNKELYETVSLLGKVSSSSSGGIINGTRADGGPVSSGGRYLVGERGPEIFSPNRPGYIIPNDQITGSRQNFGNVNFNFPGHDPIPVQVTRSSYEMLKDLEKKYRRSSS